MYSGNETFLIKLIDVFNSKQRRYIKTRRASFIDASSRKSAITRQNA